MRSNTFVFIDAHIIRCRLHHNNNLKYSVALKSGKDQQFATEYKPSKDLIIQMDTHLFLQADKHSYDNFPKLTLIVNVMNESNEKKTVGTTFANFRKEGVQIFQVSECSCKDKAFQVEISFSLKLAELKSSKSNNNKNPLQLDKKSNHLSELPTPRQSREVKQERFAKPPKENSKIDMEQKARKLNRMHSEKVLIASKEATKSLQKQKTIAQLTQQVEQLTNIIKNHEGKLILIDKLQQELQSEKENTKLLRQLLQLQQEKNSEAMSYIINLQHSFLGLLPKDHLKSTIGITTSFKVIEERDQIVQINEQLENEIQRQRRKNKFLENQIAKLKEELSLLSLKQKEGQKAQKMEASEIQIMSLNKETVYLQSHNDQILITSICKQKKETQMNTQEKQRLEHLKNEVHNLESKVTSLNIEIERLQSLKKKLDSAGTMKSLQKKVSPIKSPIGKREDQAFKSEKGGSKDKNLKPPIKPIKKSSQSIQSNIKSQVKKNTESNIQSMTQGPSPFIKIAKLASTQVQSKTQRQESLEKSSDFLSNEQKSERNIKAYNEAAYYTDGFLNQ